MATLDDLFASTLASTRYVTLTDVLPEITPVGRYVRLICQDESGEFEAIAEEPHFPLVSPYYDTLEQSRRSTAVSPPSIPLFRDASGRWRFDWRTARWELPSDPPPEDDAPPFRLQVTVSASLAHRFQQAAALQGLRHQQLLHRLITQAATGSG